MKSCWSGNLPSCEYLLNKWERKCTYCGLENIPLQIEHIQPKSKGGSNRLSNLCLACARCNQQKGTLSIDVFLASKPDLLRFCGGKRQ